MRVAGPLVQRILIVLREVEFGVVALVFGVRLAVWVASELRYDPKLVEAFVHFSRLGVCVPLFGEDSGYKVGRLEFGTNVTHRLVCLCL